MTLQIGMIGTGWFANKHARILSGMEGVRVSAILGSQKEKADRMAADFDDAKGYASIDEMLDDRKLDGVYICVPPFAHGATELTLVRRGIPFFVEKPLGTDLRTPTEILEEIEAKKLLTSVGYHFRYSDGASLARELLQDRTAGMALGYWMGGMPGVYWWRKAEGSGGQFVEQTTHVVDLLRFLMGEVSEVYAAFAGKVMHTKEDGVTVPDVGTVTLKMRSGAVANISNTCLLPVGHLTGIHVYTDGGVLELTPGGLKDIVSGRITEHQNASDPYDAENNAFIHALRTGDASGIKSTYADSWRTQQVTTAANRSAETGGPVSLD